ncbi:hypothetical protein Ancab_017154, partial [Ancistrocladus abbreviatus]
MRSSVADGLSVPPPDYCQHYQHGHAPTFTPPPVTRYTIPNPVAPSVPPPDYYQHGHAPTFTPPPETPYTNPNPVASSVPDDVPSPESPPDGDVPEFIPPPETPYTNLNPVAHSVPPRDYYQHYQHGQGPPYPELSERGRRAPEPRAKDETYDAENRQHGIAEAHPLSYFEDPTFGFMEGESCRIGIEVIIANRVDSIRTRFGHLFIPRGRWKRSTTWEVRNYSELVRDNCATSEEIKMCERR